MIVATTKTYQSYVCPQFWPPSLLSLSQPVAVSVLCSFLPIVHGAFVLFVSFISNSLALHYFILYILCVYIYIYIYCFNYSTLFVSNYLLFIITNKYVHVYYIHNSSYCYLYIYELNLAIELQH
jgi:hypothetical protein